MEQSVQLYQVNSTMPLLAPLQTTVWATLVGLVLMQWCAIACLSPQSRVPKDYFTSTPWQALYQASRTLTSLTSCSFYDRLVPKGTPEVSHSRQTRTCT